MFIFISFKVIYFVLVMGSVGFVTLLERKYLGFSQNRISVNKNTFIGILQPLLDGLKLFIKGNIVVFNSVKSIYLVSPVCMFLSYYICWEVNDMDSVMSGQLSLILLLCVMGLTVYGTVLAGLVSLNKYSMLSSIRIILQIICFEVNITTVIFMLVYLSSTSGVVALSQGYNIFVVVVLFLLVLLETMRGCFDMGESESELVSGFNLEYASMMFVMLFLSEYGSIMFMIFLFSVLLMSASGFFYILSITGVLFIRCFMVRLKIDSILGFSWLKLLPVVILLFLCLL